MMLARYTAAALLMVIAFLPTPPARSAPVNPRIVINPVTPAPTLTVRFPLRAMTLSATWITAIGDLTTPAKGFSVCYLLSVLDGTGHPIRTIYNLRDNLKVDLVRGSGRLDTNFVTYPLNVGGNPTPCSSPTDADGPLRNDDGLYVIQVNITNPRGGRKIILIRLWVGDPQAGIIWHGETLVPLEGGSEFGEFR